jgi:hypothetical protein
MNKKDKAWINKNIKESIWVSPMLEKPYTIIEKIIYFFKRIYEIQHS